MLFQIANREIGVGYAAVPFARACPKRI